MSASFRSFSLSFSFCRSRNRRCATRFFSRVLQPEPRDLIQDAQRSALADRLAATMPRARPTIVGSEALCMHSYMPTGGRR